MDEDTICGSNFGYRCWSPLWEPIAFVCFARFDGVGHVAAHYSTPPARAAMTNKHPTHRGGANRTKQRAHQAAWRAALVVVRLGAPRCTGSVH